MTNAHHPRGRWLALTAALLGWMFDGLEMGLFPLVGRPALQELLTQPVEQKIADPVVIASVVGHFASPGGMGPVVVPSKIHASRTPSEREIARWFAVAMAIFLVGAATGGVLFGWLGDRIGRVRAMTLSILTYAIFTGFCGLVTEAWQIMPLRFIAALGMGGEWSLGVALVMEVWPGRSRAFMAGLIGAAANVGFLLIGLVGRSLASVIDEARSFLLWTGLSDSLVEQLTRNESWRLLMIIGAVPALLTFFIRVWVPESERWEQERKRGATSHWAGRDLLGILIGSLAACGIIVLWAVELPLAVRVAGTVLGLVVLTGGYLYPVFRYLQRAEGGQDASGAGWKPTLGRMLLGACLSGVALLGTWGSIQWAPTWAHKLTEGTGIKYAKEDTQIAYGLGAIFSSIGAALLGGWLGRRITYVLLCIGALLSVLLLFRPWQLDTTYDTTFLVFAFLAGGMTASFYGWLPLYLPELFRTPVRATGQGFGYNFGRIIAAIGVLQVGALMALFDNSYPIACSVMSLIYFVGIAIIWLAPETRGQPLPE